MNELVPVRPHIAAMSPAAIDKVRTLESVLLGLPQEVIDTDHVLHGGLYARTVFIPVGCTITGALVKVPTLLVMQGDLLVYVEDSAPLHFEGYNVIPASANRKQAFFAQKDSWLTMIFPSAAESVAEAEEQFTEEEDMLISRRLIENNTVLITGE